MTFVFNHPEAYCLMKYRSDDGLEEELLWNSRDGVTPFTITLKSGKVATHVDWQLDTRTRVDFKPPIGMRYFTDHTEATAREAATRNVDRWWEHDQYPMNRSFPDRDSAIQALMVDYIGTPTIAEMPVPDNPIVQESKFGGPTAGPNRFA